MARVYCTAIIAATARCAAYPRSTFAVGSLESADFTVEMETGTGKTYAYLRTIFGLDRRFGFLKFVIVVPSVAIKEGVYKTLEMTEDHLTRRVRAAVIARSMFHFVLAVTHHDPDEEHDENDEHEKQSDVIVQG